MLFPALLIGHKMKFCRFSLLLGLIISGCTGGFAEAGTFIPGELLVSLQPRTAPDGLARQIQERLSTETEVEGKVAKDVEYLDAAHGSRQGTAGFTVAANTARRFDLYN